MNRLLARVGTSASSFSFSTLSPSRLLAGRRRITTSSHSAADKELPKFSESAAFQGRNRAGNVPMGKPIEWEYYDTNEFGVKKVISFFASLAIMTIYFGWLREPNDLDEIWNTPAHVLTTSLERKMLRDQIAERRAKGQDTSLLQAELEYVDVKEAALKVQFEKEEKKKAQQAEREARRKAVAQVQ